MTTRDTQQVLDTLTGWFTESFEAIESMASEFSRLIETDHDPAQPLLQVSALARRGLKERVLEVLRTHPIADGAGALFSRAHLGSVEGVIEWWVRDDDMDDRVSRYSFGVNPSGERFYDYESLEWFTNAFTNRTRTITGPYIDYLGVEEYIVTLTIPLRIHDRVVGVAGLDIRMADLERELVPILRRLPDDAALLNSHESVLVGNSGRFVSGDRVASVPQGYTVSALDMPSPALRLLHR
jgi:hypothetical protein